MTLPDRGNAIHTVETETEPRDVWILTAIMAVAFLLRAVDLHNQSFTMDEMAELGIAATGLRDIVVVADGFPPSYHFLLKFWLGVLGADSAARWLSVAFGVLTVPVIWSLGRSVGGHRVAAWSAALLALAPLHNWYSREARAYALFVLVAALTMWFLFRALDEQRRADWMGFAIVATAGVYVHYFFPVLLAVGIAIVLLERKRLESLRPAVLAYVVIAVASLPVLYVLQADFAFQAADTRQTAFDLGAFVFTYLSVVTGFTIGPSLRDLHDMGLREAATGMLIWAPVLVFGVLVLAIGGWRALRGTRWFARLLILGFGTVLLAGGVATLGGIGFRVRYVSYIVIPVLLWFASGIAWGRQRWSTRAATLLLLLIFVVALVNRRTNERYAEEDTRALAEYLVSDPRGSTQVFVNSAYMTDPIGYYLPSGWEVIPVPRVDERGEGLAESIRAIESGAKPGKGFWLAYSREFDGDPAGLFLDGLNGGWRVSLEAEFPGVRLYRVAPGR